MPGTDVGFLHEFEVIYPGYSAREELGTVRTVPLVQCGATSV